MRLFVAALLSLLAFVGSACNACDRTSPNGDSTIGASTSALQNGKKPFGAACVTDGDCGDGVCFHQRASRGHDAGRERRDGGDAEEPDGYCSMRCVTDPDCPTPLTRGKCGARGMCKRN